VYSRDLQECLDKRDRLLEKERSGIPTLARDMLLGDWLTYWLEEIIRVENPGTTYQTYESPVRLYLKPRIGKKTLVALSIRDVRAFKAAMLRDKPAPTAHLAMKALRSALKAAMREDLLVRSVAELVEMPELEPREVTQWSPQETARFILAAREHFYYVAFLCAGLLGLRHGELRGLRWEHISFEDETIRIVRQRQRIKTPSTDAWWEERKPKGKGRKRHPLLAIPRLLLGPLRALHVSMGEPTEGPVFLTSTGTPIGFGSVREAFKRLLRRLGLPEIRLHDLRGGLSSLLARLGAQPHVVQALMGHTSLDITFGTYAAAQLDEQAQALASLSDYLELLSPAGVSLTPPELPPASTA
jgi:integrase